ncbi:MAG: TlpA family protein disulfide reductase [Planctomycetota bacterium]
MIAKILGAGFITISLIAAFGCTRAPEAKTASAAAPNATTLSEVIFTSTPGELAELLKPKGKPLVINHWATWCGPCVDELPYFAEMATKYAGRVEFIGVAWDNFDPETSDPVKAKNRVLEGVNGVRAKTGATFHTIIAPFDISDTAQKLQLLGESVPQTYVISKNGTRAWTFKGEIVEDSDKDAFTKAIEDALKE